MREGILASAGTPVETGRSLPLSVRLGAHGAELSYGSLGSFMSGIFRDFIDSIVFSAKADLHFSEQK